MLRCGTHKPLRKQSDNNSFSSSLAPSAISTTFSRMLVEQQVGALLVAADPFFANRRAQVIALAERHTIPAIYQFREFSVAGGLISYGASLPDFIGSPAFTLAAFSKAKGQPTCPSCNRLSSSW